MHLKTNNHTTFQGQIEYPRIPSKSGGKRIRKPILLCKESENSSWNTPTDLFSFSLEAWSKSDTSSSPSSTQTPVEVPR
ncbi:hypothetical protein glysoja_028264 [Glycine soja]|uniref:Uncharacterized protein n=1 Tax=Glycine soja TaxID=3848 RepID=A0A0B2QCB9_GLYSO|nr:hypothetical protein glysoja_028264 [Glycine soja]